MTDGGGCPPHGCIEDQSRLFVKKSRKGVLPQWPLTRGIGLFDQRFEHRRAGGDPPSPAPLADSSESRHTLSGRDEPPAYAVSTLSLSQTVTRRGRLIGGRSGGGKLSEEAQHLPQFWSRARGSTSACRGHRDEAATPPLPRPRGTAVPGLGCRLAPHRHRQGPQGRGHPDVQPTRPAPPPNQPAPPARCPMGPHR